MLQIGTDREGKVVFQGFRQQLLGLGEKGERKRGLLEIKVSESPWLPRGKPGGRSDLREGHTAGVPTTNNGNDKE